MTPEERAVIDAAVELYDYQTATQNGRTDSPEVHPGIALRRATAELLASRQPQLQWYARTWVDVRPGDRIRMSGVEAHVLSVTPLHWHVHPATGTGPGNPPVAHEHTLISYRLAAPYDKQLYQIQPTAPVAIQEDERAIRAWLDGEPIGTVEDYWRNRLSVQDS